MSLFNRKKQVIKCDSVQYCLQINDDKLIFFPTRENMRHYLSDYRKKVAVYKLSAFRVEFYQEFVK